MILSNDRPPPCSKYWRIVLQSCLLIAFLLIRTVHIHGARLDKLAVNEIKENPIYIWGEGTSHDLTTANRIANENLLRKIQVSISVTSTASIMETETNFASNFESTHTSVSSLFLKGLQYLEGEYKDVWISLAYIHNDSLSASFNHRKQKIRQYIEIGNKALNEGMLTETLRNYYWGYLLSKTITDTLHLTFKGAMSSIPHIAIPNQIHKVISNISIQTMPAYYDDYVAIAPLTMTYNEIPVKELLFVYYSGSGMEYALTVDGKADLPFYDQISSPSRKIVMIVEYAFEPNMSTDPEIAELHDLFGEAGINNILRTEINFPRYGKEAYVGSENEPSPITYTTVEDKNTLVNAISQPEPSIVHSESIQLLSQNKNTRRFLMLLDQYEKLGVIEFGSMKQFNENKNCYIAVLDEQKVNALLHYSKGVYCDLNSQTSYDDLRASFAGNRLVWIREAGKADD